MSSVSEKFSSLLEKINNYKIESQEELEKFRIQYLGTKNVLKDLFSEIKNVPVDQKKAFGEQVNCLKQKAEEKFEDFKNRFSSNKDISTSSIDLSLPADIISLGSRHPVSLVKNQVIEIFSKIGFNVATGPEIEDEWHNFTALNTPQDHPARDMTDTFYLQQNPDVILRSQTSTVQVRTMESQKPPIRIIAPGRVYRNETISYKHHVYFHQLEGLYINDKVSFADLKQTLYYFIKEFFGDDFNIRFRPSYFPFTEPSAELDICHKDNNKWMEILGCGMVHPSVLKNCKINPEQYTGFAFGMGIERLAMLKFGIKDLRIMYDNDIRVLKQFSSTF